MTATTEVWTRWTFEDPESAKAAEPLLREELARVPGASEVSVGTEPPNLGVVEVFTLVIGVISLPYTINEAIKSTGELATRLGRLGARLRGLRRVAIEDGEGGEVPIPPRPDEE
ncbi:hypothetical protein [Kitasatospora sp. NPDC097691]|uniref:hypothetical protein n=1 Tax=Kitasatospora sp. NPDC097691 TaxID=3157231 RepID=UPI00332F9574